MYNIRTQNNPNHQEVGFCLWNIHCKSTPNRTLTFTSPILSLIWTIATASLPLVFPPPTHCQLSSSSTIWCHSPYSKPFQVSSMPARWESNPLGWFRGPLHLALWTPLQPHFLLFLTSFSPFFIPYFSRTTSFIFLFPMPFSSSTSFNIKLYVALWRWQGCFITT